MARRFSFSGLVMMLMVAGASRADDSIDLPSYLHFSGFGTLGLATSDNSHYALMRDQSDGKGIGASTSPLWSDSRLGLQMDAELTPELSATIQGVFRKDPPISFTDSVQWAFLKYQPASWLQLRVGRMGTDSFMLSDMRNIGFTYLWVRPPVEFYGLFPAYSYDGVNAIYQARLSEDWSLELEGLYGASRITLANSGAPYYDLKIPVFWGGNVILRDDNWTFRLSGLQGRIGNNMADLEQLSSALDSLSALESEAGIAARALDLKGGVRFYSAGVAYDDGVWTGQAEYGRTECACQLVSGDNAAYGVIGRHFGEWTPFISYSRAWQSDRPAVFSSSLPIPQVQALFAATNQIMQSGSLDQDDRTVGVRWNFSEQADLKIQFDNYNVRNFASAWRPLTDTPSLTAHGTVNLFSASIDFIF